VRSDHQGRGWASVFLERWLGAIYEKWRAHRPEVSGRAKADGRAFAFGGSIGPVAFSTVERHFLSIHGKEILAKKLAQMLKQVAKTAHNGVIAPYSVSFLPYIDDIHHDDGDEPSAHQEHKKLG